MRKIISGGVVTLLVAGGLVLATGGGASAHTPTVTHDCDSLDVAAVYYETRPAVGEPTVTVENPDYIAPIPGTPAIGDPTIWVPNPDYVAEVPANPGTTEYLYRQLVTGKEKWLDSVTWNPGLGWYLVYGVTRVVGATPAIPAVGSPTIEVPNPAYVPAVDEVPAVGSPTLELENPDYVPGDDTPNHVVVVVDGATLADAEFGESYSASFPLFAYTAHDYTVTITAWNDPDGSKGWTDTFTGSTTACAPPVAPANPAASIAAVCGQADVTMTNVQADYQDNLTASFVIEVDGVFYGAYTLEGNENRTVSIGFGEDSGDHTVEVFQAGTSEWASIATGTVPSDCATEPTPGPTPGPTDPSPTVPGPGVADDEPTTAVLQLTEHPGTGDPINWAPVAWIGGGAVALGVLVLLAAMGATRTRRMTD